MRHWIIAVYVLFSSALAVTKPFNPKELWRVVANPNAFKADEYYTDSIVNPGYLVNEWQWNLDKKKFPVHVSLQKTKDAKGWKLYSDFPPYTLKALTTISTLLYILDDQSTHENISVYRVDFGQYKGVFFAKNLFRDGSFSIEIVSKAFAKYAADSSSFDHNGTDYLVSYHYYGYLTKRSKFCLISSSLYKVDCKY